MVAVPRNTFTRLRRTLTRTLTLSAVSMGEWPTSVDNSLLRELRADQSGLPPEESREVLGAHYVRVRPSVPSPSPSLVCYSPEVAELLGLTPAECQTPGFLRTVSGSPPKSLDCWATAYGASFAGRYGGQRGDGRAISIGQVAGMEVQLKGAGVTPFSRRFDGRAVLRSSVREFLASEAMHHLRVPTTRALCVVATGDQVRRVWYDSDGREVVGLEPGAIGVRASPSFLRFGQFELFHQREETPLLHELAHHALRRDFAHLRLQVPSAPFSQQLVDMFREVCERQATLVAEWMRVGYCQGNLNSDNSALCGVTLDYGPFGFLERFDPLFCPWVGGGDEYSFSRQPQAIAINLSILAEAFAEVLRDAAASEKLPRAELDASLQRLRDGVSQVYVDRFHSLHDSYCQAKLGLQNWDDEAVTLWSDLLGLMARKSGPHGIDFTIFFRALGELPAGLPVREGGASKEGVGGDAARGGAGDKAAGDGAGREVLGGGDGLGAARSAAIGGMGSWPADHVTGWRGWAGRYWARVAAEGRDAGKGSDERREQMGRVNPNYILRNWMAAEAYEAAARGDATVIEELMRVLRHPYSVDSAADARWCQPTPDWARNVPGLAFMS